ncbi:transposase [Pelagicoccus sp. SDUM812002]|uniref:transposase n=1 Tax=Pelagicoccus sp. SDUM812002 TaxID=3041266 RepID=UPI0034E1D52E
MFLLFWDDVKSERELLRCLPERLDYLWFLGYGLDDPIADHSALSKARRPVRPCRPQLRFLMSRRLRLDPHHSRNRDSPWKRPGRLLVTQPSNYARLAFSRTRAGTLARLEPSPRLLRSLVPHPSGQTLTPRSRPARGSAQARSSFRALGAILLSSSPYSHWC